jgi:hypothetical protein
VKLAEVYKMKQDLCLSQEPQEKASRQAEPAFDGNFDSLRGCGIEYDKRTNEFSHGNTTQTLGVESAWVKTASLVGNLKACIAEQSSARNVSDHRAFVVQKGNAQNNHRPALLHHPQVHQPNLAAPGHGHYDPAFSS